MLALSAGEESDTRREREEESLISSAGFYCEEGDQKPEEEGFIKT